LVRFIQIQFQNVCTGLLQGQEKHRMDVDNSPGPGLGGVEGQMHFGLRRHRTRIKDLLILQLHPQDIRGMHSPLAHTGTGDIHPARAAQTEIAALAMNQPFDPCFPSGPDHIGYRVTLPYKAYPGTYVHGTLLGNYQKPHKYHLAID
jgi:hypothetical protein